MRLRAFRPRGGRGIDAQHGADGGDRVGSRQAAELDAAGVLHVAGSALEDSVLADAGIGSAGAIVVATGSDADNVYITLSAREKNSGILIYARGDSDAGLRRLKLAGADQVVAAYQWAGLRIAASILRPSVVDFLQLSVPGRESEVDLEEIRVSRASPAAGKTIGGAGTGKSAASDRRDETQRPGTRDDSRAPRRRSKPMTCWS